MITTEVTKDELVEDELDNDIFDEEVFEVIDIDEEELSDFTRLSDYPSSTEMSLYLAEIGQFPRISADDEIRLSNLVQAGIKAKEQLTDDNHSELSPIILAGQSAREQLINANYRLVIAVAKRFFWRRTASFTIMDIVQSGNLGLMKAVDKFDTEQGVRFSTYATYWIAQSVRREIANNSAVIRIPIHVQDWLSKIHRLEQEENLYSPAELAVRLDLSEHKVEHLLHIRDTARTGCLDRNTNRLDIEPDENILMDAIASPVLAPDKVEQLSQLESGLQDVLSNRLTDREYYIIVRRFGLRDGKRLTLEVLGEELGLTRERIRQIEHKAMFKLRGTRTQNILKDLIRVR